MRKIDKRKKLNKTSFFKNVVILLIAHVFIKILGVINKIYLTNREGFGDEGNAIYSSAFQVYALFLTISSMGIPNAVSKLVSERLAIGDAKGAHKVFKIAIISFGFLGFLLSLFVFTFAHRISNNWLQIPEAELSLLALSPSIFFVAITSVIKGYFNGRENLNIGNRINDVYALGTPNMIVMGKKFEEGKFELETSKTGEKETFTIDELITRLKRD